MFPKINWPGLVGTGTSQSASLATAPSWRQAVQDVQEVWETALVKGKSNPDVSDKLCWTVQKKGVADCAIRISRMSKRKKTFFRKSLRKQPL